MKEARLFLFVLFTHDWPFMLCPFAFNLNETNTHSFPFHLFCFILNAKETKFTSLFVLLLRLIVMERREARIKRNKNTNHQCHRSLATQERKEKEKRTARAFFSFHYRRSFFLSFPFVRLTLSHHSFLSFSFYSI